MTNIQTSMAAQTPSGFGMPGCGHAFAATTGLIATASAFGALVRDRQADADFMGYAVKSIPGTTAWRPPPS